MVCHSIFSDLICLIGSSSLPCNYLYIFICKYICVSNDRDRCLLNAGAFKMPLKTRKIIHGLFCFSLDVMQKS